MTAVNISGTFAKDERPYNGLEDVADQLVKDEFGEHYVIGRVKPHGYNKKPGEPMVPVTKFMHIEVVTEDDAAWVMKKLDERYQERSGRDPQMTLDFTPPNGERQVPEPSAEELMAERREAREAEEREATA